MLSPAVAFEGFEPVARRHAQVLEAGCCADHDELAVHDALKVLRQPAGDEAPVKFFGFGVGETLDHARLITQHVISVKRSGCHAEIEACAFCDDGHFQMAGSRLGSAPPNL